MNKLFTLLILCASLFVGFPALADFYDGFDAYEKKDYATALGEWKPLAEKGDDSAQFYLGVLYDSGYGVPQDYKEAVKWWRLSAEQGHMESQYNLGIMYSQGLGIPQDYREAAKWYRLATEQGLGQAQFNLGVQYYNGNGVPQDYIQAHMWYNLAASGGEENAAEYRDDVAKKLTPEQIIRAQDLARECLAKDYKGC